MNEEAAPFLLEIVFGFAVDTPEGLAWVLIVLDGFERERIRALMYKLAFGVTV